MKIDVGENIVEPIVRDQVAAAIASHLGDPEDLIRKLVGAAMKVKTNANGVVSSSSYENNHDFMEALCGKMIREAAKASLEKVVKEQAPAIEQAITEQLKRSPKKTAAAIMSAMIEGQNLRSYRTTFTINFNSDC